MLDSLGYCASTLIRTNSFTEYCILHPPLFLYPTFIAILYYFTDRRELFFYLHTCFADTISSYRHCLASIPIHSPVMYLFSPTKEDILITFNSAIVRTKLMHLSHYAETSGGVRWFVISKVTKGGGMSKMSVQLRQANYLSSSVGRKGSPSSDRWNSSSFNDGWFP